MNPSEPRRLYTLDFIAQAIELLASGSPVVKLAAEFCVSANLLQSSKSSSQTLLVGSVGENAVAEDLRSRVGPLLIEIHCDLSQERILDQGRFPVLKHKF